MKFKVLIAATVAVLSGLLFVATAGQASAAIPNCGGQNAAPQPVPYTCNLPGIDITSQGVTRHFAAQVVVNGQTVSVTYLMTGGLLSVDVPVVIYHHTGISSNPTTPDSAKGVIKAGTNTVTVFDSSPCRDGQLDVFAVGEKQDKYRVGGPWIQNGTNCTTPTTTPGSTVPSTTTPLSSTAPTSVPNTSGGPGVSAVAPVSALPATGGETTSAAFLAVLALSVGLVLVGLAYHRRGLRH